MTDREDQSDRRVGETLSGQGGEADDDRLDPELVARLEAWFAGPATSMPAPSGEVPAPARAEAPESREKSQRDKALEAVDPALLGRLEDQGARAGAMVEPLQAPEPTLDPSISRFDYAVWGLQGIGDVREVERPEDIQFAVQERAPQAILRDLHRPVRQYGDVYLRPLDLGIDRSGQRARDQIEELVIQRRYRIELDREPSARRLLREGEAELREILEQPWERSKPAKPRPAPSEWPDANDMRWFGSVGIDPDQ